MSDGQKVPALSQASWQAASRAASLALEHLVRRSLVPSTPKQHIMLLDQIVILGRKIEEFDRRAGSPAVPQPEAATGAVEGRDS